MGKMVKKEDAQAKIKISKGNRNITVFFIIGLTIFIVIVSVYVYWGVPGFGMGFFD